MSEHKRHTAHLIIAAVLLFTVSAYRQISINFWPQDIIRPYLVYAAYMVLLFWWQYSISTKILQRNMCRFLTAQNMISVVYLTVRFVQDAFLYTNIPLMRFTGYFINIPAVLIPLFGLYAAFYLGKGENYQINPKWFLMLIPAAGLIIMALTNEYHHFLCYVVPEEPQPNLYFHPYIGTWMIYLWSLSIIAYQIYYIEKQSGARHEKKLYKKLVPVYEPLLLLAFSVPYIISNYVIRFELVEYSAGIIFIIVLCWELYILIGLIPVNIGYDDVFRKSTIAMQILEPDGEHFIESENALTVTTELFEDLIKNKCVFLENTALYLHEIEGEYVIWQNDMTELHEAIQTLRNTNEMLKQDKELIEKEIQIQTNEIDIQSRNRIYDSLTSEVMAQFTLLQKLLAKDPKSPMEWGRICLVGTYIKRFCNLRLIYQETGHIPNQDLQISLNDMIDCMDKIQIPASLDFRPYDDLDPVFSLNIVKCLEQIIEVADFELKSVNIQICDGACYKIEESTFPYDSISLDEAYHVVPELHASGMKLFLMKESEVDEI